MIQKQIIKQKMLRQPTTKLTGNSCGAKLPSPWFHYLCYFFSNEPAEQRREAGEAAEYRALRAPVELAKSYRE